MKNFYLVMAIVGALVPIAFFLGVFHPAVVGPIEFIPAIFANSAAGGFTADLLITSLVFWMFMLGDEKGPKPWLFIALNLCIGLSCAFPAYLYRRAALDTP